MGGGVSAEINAISEVNRQKHLPADASDIENLESAKLEIVRLRSVLTNPRNEHLWEYAREEHLSILSNLANHDDSAADVVELEKAKVELCLIRAVCAQVEINEETLEVLLESIEEPKIAEASANSIISESLREKIKHANSAKLFKEFDKDKSGLMDKSEMRRFLRMQGIKYTEEDFVSLYNLFDVNGDGKFSYGEFVSAFTSQAETVTQAAENIISLLRIKLGTDRSQFESIDRDSSGLVDKSEMRRLLRMKNIQYEEEEFNAIFVKYDLNGDGKLAYDEFAAVLQERKA